jgi:hypothetical protein
VKDGLCNFDEDKKMNNDDSSILLKNYLHLNIKFLMFKVCA